MLRHTVPPSDLLAPTQTFLGLRHAFLPDYVTRDERKERLRGRLDKNNFSVFVSSVGGIFLGGFIVRKFDLKKSLKMAARFCVICQVFTIIGSGSWFIPGCGTPDLAGLLVPYHGSR